MESSSYYDTTTFGVRFKGEDGWHVCGWPMTYEDVVKELKQRKDIAEVREITQGFSRVRDEHGNPLRDEHLTEYMAFDFGWAFDPYANRFRAPGEVLSSPPGEPTAVSEFHIEFTKPEAGWTDLNIRVNEVESSIRCSYVFDPFEDIVKWLESIAKNENSRVLINEEGVFSGFSSYGISANEMRFVLHHYWHGLTVPIDCLINKRLFVRIVYGEIQSFVSDYDALYDQWVWGMDKMERVYPSLKSDELEKYLCEVDS